MGTTIGPVANVFSLPAAASAEVDKEPVEAPADRMGGPAAPATVAAKAAPDGVQREVVSFGPGGLTLKPGEAIELPRKLKGDAVIGATVLVQGMSRAVPRA